MTTEEVDFREFKITTKEVWRDLQEFRNETREEASEVREMLAKIDNKLDVVSLTMTHATKSVEDHETRIRVIEKTVWRAVGAAAFLSGLAGIAASFIAR